uniref:Uncharacterized protein n=1 Tax=Haptolina ericina TaxID=156174 RepID=A0A7S3BJY2_9EUKA
MDLADLLNFSQLHRLPRWWRHPRYFHNWRKPLFDAAARALSADYDTLSFRSHVDAGCCGGMRMHELVSLRGVSERCPFSNRLRRGWHGALRACDCADPNRPANGTSFGKAPRRFGTKTWQAVC